MGVVAIGLKGVSLHLPACGTRNKVSAALYYDALVLTVPQKKEPSRNIQTKRALLPPWVLCKENKNSNGISESCQALRGANTQASL